MTPKKPAPGLEPGVATGFRERSYSNNPAAQQRGKDFGGDHDREDDEQHEAGAIPVEIVERGFQRHAEAAAADQAEHRRFADVDVPAEDRDREKSGLYLRPVALGEDREPRRAGGGERLDRARLRLLDRFREYFSGEADRVHGDGERARERAGAEYRDEEKRPHHGVHRTRRDQNETGDGVERDRARDVARGQQRDEACQEDGEDRAERRRVQRLDQRRVHAFAVPRPVDRPHAGEHLRGLRRRVLQEFGNDLDGLDRPEHREHGEQIEARAQDALGERKAPPTARYGRRRGRHWNSLRIQPERISPTVTVATMASTMVRTKS